MLRSFAEPIWRDAYREIISEEQILYMLDRGYSTETVRDEIENLGVEYLWIRKGAVNAGFVAVECDREEEAAFLHKFYVATESQGTGVATTAMEQLASLLCDRRLSAIHLRVNRFNRRAIRFYERCGFVVTREDVLPIGNDFLMDDFLMERSLH